MTETLSDLLALSPGQLAFALAAVFVAGAVRGFTGFALSAFVMASLATIIPPVELIPVCTMLELTSASVLLRGGFGEADKRLAVTLQGGSTLIGVPAGLYLTNMIDPALSKLTALCLVVALALAQLLRLRLPVSAAPLPTFLTGIVSGFVTGLASIGGMVIALYTLALQMPPRTMRGSLILIIFIGGLLTFLWQIAYGMIDTLVLSRYAVFALPMLAGVFLGRAFFTPANERYYRPVSLTLLIGLGLAGIGRLAL